jgi:hypothetical protein
VRVWQGRAAREAEALLLPRPALRHVHGQPRRPWRVAPHLGAGVGVARLELLRGGGGFRAPQSPGVPCPHPAPPAPALTTPQPGQELPFSQARRRDCTPPPQLLLHLLQEPQVAQKMGTGQGVFSLQNLGRREGRVVTLRRGTAAPDKMSQGVRRLARMKVPWVTLRIQAAFQQALQVWDLRASSLRSHPQPRASSPLLPTLAHADAASMAGRRVAATSLADLETDPTGRTAQRPR